MISIGHFRGLRLLFSFYLHKLDLIRSLPTWLSNPDVFNRRVAAHRAGALRDETAQANFSWETPISVSTTVKPTIELDVSNQNANKFNSDMEQLKQEIRGCTQPSRSFESTMLIMLCVRLLTIGAAIFGNLKLTVICMSLQFVFIPYSFFVSFAMLIAFIPSLYLNHYISWVLLRFLLLPLPLAWRQATTLTIGPNFIVAFFVVDFVLCCACQFRGTAKGPTEQWEHKRVLKHVAFGFANSKTYWLVMLPLLFSTPIDGLVWILDMLFGVSPRVGKMIASVMGHYSALFYMQHRLGHLPRVYEEAHKFHHYLHDASAFDAHIYGSGAPEEFFPLLAEMLGVFTLGMAPPSLNYHTLMTSWSNKMGHSRSIESHGGLNHHADHHVLHSKNYGIYNCLLDMYLGTNSDNAYYDFAEYTISKAECADGSSTFRFCSIAKPKLRKTLDRYYKPDMIGLFSIVRQLAFPRPKAS